jgi:HAD superfamily hydrolase (TIGR01509 family)
MDTTNTRPVQWQSVDVVLLDMDGTLLDLGFDNYFWRAFVPERYSRHHGVSLEEARARLEAWYLERQGTLQWYCLEYWRDRLEMDVVAMKREIRHRIRVLPDVPRFLESVRRSGKRLVLVTNAHRDSLIVKMECTALHAHFDAVYSSHDFGLPKEDSGFWLRLQEIERFSAPRTLLVDDSLPVLESARRFGIGQLVAIRRPELDGPARQVQGFEQVDGVSELIDPDESS